MRKQCHVDGGSAVAVGVGVTRSSGEREIVENMSEGKVGFLAEVVDVRVHARAHHRHQARR